MKTYNFYLVLMWVFMIFIITLSVKCQFDLSDYGVIIDQKHKSKLYWGTYKPNLYFSMKNRRNSSDVFGLMWYGSGSDNYESQGDLSKRVRHACKMDDKLNYRWKEHNGVDYGNQVIEDKTNELTFTTKFVKTEYNTTLNQKWDVYLKGETNSDNLISVILYGSMEDFAISDKSFFNLGNNFLNFFNEGDRQNINFSAMEKGNEKYGYSISFGSNSKLISKSFQRYRKRYNETWRIKKYLIDDLNTEENNLFKRNKPWKHVDLKSNQNINTPNIVAIQLVFEGSFEIFIRFSTDVKSQDTTNMLDYFVKKEAEFDKKFDNIYWSKLKNEKFTDLEMTEELTLDLKEMCKQALSSILGGIGYFYGKIKINLEGKPDSGTYHKGFRYAVEEKGLFTATPSRSFFARGFLWDEGFHNIIISQWDVDISIDIIDSWLSTMSATGWMAREQIRGKEAESQVPSKFITQDKMIANPPTFIFPLENILNYYKYYNEEKNLKYVNNFLKKCFDKFGAWFEWFEIYQKSTDRKSYQWYGRNTEHNMASGLDDYPRAMTPNIYERHLDLTIWVIELTKTLRSLSELFDYELVSHFDKQVKKLTEDLPKLYGDEANGILSDYLGPQFKLIGVENFKRPIPPYLWRNDGKCGKENLNTMGYPSECNPYSPAPCCSEFGWCGNTPNHCTCEKCEKSIKLEDRPEYKEKENIFNPHIGYINLFPLAFGLIKPEDKYFKNLLEFLKSPDELFSNYGIRSLSKSDSLYHSGENYWRGNIWININFIVLRGLYKYYRNNENAFILYKKIRQNLINTVFNQWNRDKTFYEQYSDFSGEGLRANPFNGWTSLILNIVTEKYEN